MTRMSCLIHRSRTESRIPRLLVFGLCSPQDSFASNRLHYVSTLCAFLYEEWLGPLHRTMATVLPNKWPFQPSLQDHLLCFGHLILISQWSLRAKKAVFPNCWWGVMGGAAEENMTLLVLSSPLHPTSHPWSQTPNLSLYKKRIR